MPIWWGDRLIGFFGIGARPPRCFAERDVETLALFARHAAIAIENAHLFEAEQRRAARIATIARISRLIAGSLSLQETVRTAVQAISEQLHLAYVAAGIVDPDDAEQLMLLAHAGMCATAVPADYRQSIYQGLVGVAARRRRRVLVNDVAHDARYLPMLGSAAIRAELAAPIIVGSELLGVLNVESEHRIGDDDATGIATMADQIAIATDYAPRYVLGHADAEMDRLIQQARVFGDLTLHLLRSAGLERGMHVLDVGRCA